MLFKGISMPGTETTQNYDEIFADDKLDIKPYVVDFAHLIEQDTYKEGTSSKVYTISAEFGSGKTFFCDKLKEVLSKDQVKVRKLNIWEMDFYENPLVPVLAELNNLYTKKGKNLPSKIIKTITNVGKKAVSVMGETAVKIGYCYAMTRMSDGTPISINETDIDNAWNICKEHLSSETIYDDYKEYQTALYNLKETLSKWSSKQEKPIVIIIDELDRCKPDYAVKTLEVLKHFFDVPGFVFVLAIDEEQLKNSVQTLFGTIDYEGYKRKFINNSFLLPEPDKLAFSNFLYDKSGINDIIKKIQDEKRELVFTISIYDTFRCAHSYSQHGNVSEEEKSKQFNKTQTSESIIKRYFAAYSECFDFSLRKMEQVFDRLVLFVKQIHSSKELFSPDLAVFLVCVHEANLESFEQIRNTDKAHSSIVQTAISSAYANKTNNYKKTYKKFEKIDRSIVPEIFMLAGYSSIIDHSKEEAQRIIFDNVDRFYVSNSEVWLSESGVVDTKKLIVYQGGFDAQKFRENYCKHIEFISHFE